jgi:hypothetical protein
MIRFPTLALVAALAAGTALTPVLAKDKKSDQPAGPQLSPAFRTAALTAQDALKANNAAAAEPAVVQAEGLAKSDDEKYYAAQFRLQLEAIKEKAAQAANPNAPIDESSLRAPLEVLIASPRTPPEARASYAYERAKLSYEQKQFADAVTWFTKAKQFGNTDPQLDLLTAQAKLNAGDTSGGLADLNAKIDQMTAAGQKAPEDYYKFALSTSIKKGSHADAIAWMKRWLTAYPTQENWHTALDIYAIDPKSAIAKLDKQQLIDVFRLLRQAKSLGDEYNYVIYAQDVIDVGLPDEARTVIGEGRASGKVPTNPTSTGLLADATKGISNEGSLTTLEARAKTAPDGKLASQTGDAYLGKGEYAKAITLYQLALQKGGVNADAVNTHLGIALSATGDKAGAKAAFGAVTAGTRGEIASFWTFWLDHPAAA